MERLRICAEAKPAWFDAHNQIAGAARILAPNIVPGLLRLGDTGVPAPSLATTWGWEDDRTLQLELEPGRTFATGRPVDARAVARNLERAVRVRGVVFNDDEFRAIADCVALGETTVILRLSRPFAPLPGVLANGFGLVDPAEGPPPCNTNGAGRFRIRSASDRGFELESVDYPRRSVEWAFCTSPAARRRRIRSGAADVLIGEAGVAFAEAQGWSVDATAGAGPIHIAFNLRRWPGSSRAFRRSVLEAVDRREVIAKGFGGRGRAGAGPYAPGTPLHLEFESGGAPPSGRRSPRQLPELELAVGGSAYLAAARVVARAIERALRARVNVVSVPNPEWWPAYYMGGAWDLAVQAWTPMADPHLVYGRRYASWGLHNATGYVDERLDRAVRAAETCIDPATRLSHYADAERVRASNLPTIYLGFPDRLLSCRPGISPPAVRPTWEVEL